MAEKNNLDVIIMGAGLSGITAAYRLQEGVPDYSYAILEGREEMGGTWSLFKYPGIRSDSDLFTFGFPFDPWTEDKAIADAPSILAYMKRTAAKHGIDTHIRYRHHVETLNWVSAEQRWHLTVTVNGTITQSFSARYILMGTGYYDYNEPLASTIPGLTNFKGQIIHPQFWPESLDYTDKKVVIIGSGATAATLLPAMTAQAASVTMLQRSPSYFLAHPLVEPIDTLIRRVVPTRWAHSLIRVRFLWMGFLFFHFCRLFPVYARKMLQGEAAKLLPKDVAIDPHFAPTYSPWQQRMCIVPDGDFFAALRSGKGRVVTGTIAGCTADGVQLGSGEVVPADIVITATGLKIQLGGHSRVLVDGVPMVWADKFVWKGALIQDVPNLAFVFGYTNASWTLGADATARLFVRLIAENKKRGMGSVVPRIEREGSVKEVPMLNLNSTYIRSARERGVIPKGGDIGPWVPRKSYFIDFWNAKCGGLREGLQFQRIGDVGAKKLVEDDSE